MVGMGSRGALSQSRRTSLSILVPAYNEQYLIASSLRRLEVLGESNLLDQIQVIVVDDCSRDQTPDAIAAFREGLSPDFGNGKFQWLFLRHDHNQGKGGAVRTAIDHAQCELSVIHDADLEYHPRDLLQMIPLFFGEDADAVFGSRFLAGGFKRALFFRHSIANHVLTFLCDLACDLNLTDMETCYKMVRTELLRSIPLVSRDFRIEPELTIKLAKRGARIFEVPISYSGRTYQEGKKIGWKDGIKALGAVIKFAVTENICKHDQFASELVPRLSRSNRLNTWLADSIRPYVGEEVLELGAGVGHVTTHLIPRKSYWAADANPLFVRELEKLQATRPYLRPACIHPSEPSTFPLNERFDTIICRNVLEHVHDDTLVLQSVAGMLRPGGRAILVVPQGPRMLGSLDNALAVFRRYDRARIEELALKSRLRLKVIEPFNRAGSPGWWLNSRILGRQRFGLFQMKLFDIFVPLARRLDGLLPFPPMTLVAVLEKPAVPDELGASHPAEQPRKEPNATTVAL